MKMQSSVIKNTFSSWGKKVLELNPMFRRVGFFYSLKPNRMTKKEFLSEIVFSYKGDLDQLYKFRRDNSGIGSMGSILMTVAFRDDDPKYHFCNVDRVTDGKFYGFKFLFGKKRTYIINLKDLTPVV